MPAGNCVISFINEDAEGEHGAPCSAAVSEGAGMQSSAAATEAACLHCTALVAGQHPELVLLTSNPTPKPQRPGKTPVIWTSLLRGCWSLLPTGQEEMALSWARGGLDWKHFFH